MQKLQTEVLVIGGGATGTGVARDLAMRGFDTVLVEKADLTHGTTGRYHGLLHSGGRYVVKDPTAAKECIEENRILRKIMPQCIEDTGGFFVLTPWDDPDYAAQFIDGCRKAGIPLEELTIPQMLREEAKLNPGITRCFRVPDASADSFHATDLNANSAQLYGAKILKYHEVKSLIADTDIHQKNSPRRVMGAICLDRVRMEDVAIYADIIVNASGAWAGQIAQTAGINLTIIGGKGVMLAMNHRIVNTVINRCKMPADGDILVPAHTVCVIGTTDVRIDNPDQVSIDPWEVNLCLEEGDKLVPGFKTMRMLRAWAGVRPLYQESAVSDTREITRAFVLLDHEMRDGVQGLVTITSGKWTTYRKMAEVTVDLVCQKLGVVRPCKTHLEALPGSDRGNPVLGGRLATIEAQKTYGRLICECELATEEDVTKAILEQGAHTIDDIRRDVRLGMGPCQGGFCTYRVAGLLHQKSNNGQAQTKPRVQGTNVALRDFLQERWKGLLPILWGQQLRQERLDEMIYLNVLNADHLPGPEASQLAAEMYSPPQEFEPEVQAELDQKEQIAKPEIPAVVVGGSAADVLIIGGGLAGLVAAWRSALSNKHVRLVTAGWGALHWGTGCIDVLGYYPVDHQDFLDSPLKGIQQLQREHPEHPYSTLSIDQIQDALEAFKYLCAEAGYPLHGDLNANWLLPSATGTVRPTCLAPETMIAGDLSKHDPMLIVGFRQFPDFYAELIADNLAIQGIPARGVTIDVPALRTQRFVTPRVLASLFENPAFSSEMAKLIKPELIGSSRVGLPAVLGMRGVLKIKEDLESELGLPIFEIPTLPPSIPGIRLHNLLLAHLQMSGVRINNGMNAVNAIVQGKRVLQVYTEAAARMKAHPARAFVLATGGFLGGGFVAEYSGAVREVVFNQPLNIPVGKHNWFNTQFLAPDGHPIYRAGLQISSDLRIVLPDGNSVFDNLFVAGGAIGNCDSIRERSLEGIALATGFVAGNMISQ